MNLEICKTSQSNSKLPSSVYQAIFIGEIKMLVIEHTLARKFKTSMEGNGQPPGSLTNKQRTKQEMCVNLKSNQRQMNTVLKPLSKPPTNGSFGWSLSHHTCVIFSRHFVVPFFKNKNQAPKNKNKTIPRSR